MAPLYHTEKKHVNQKNLLTWVFPSWYNIPKDNPKGLVFRVVY